MEQKSIHSIFKTWWRVHQSCPKKQCYGGSHTHTLYYHKFVCNFDWLSIVKVRVVDICHNNSGKWYFLWYMSNYDPKIQSLQIAKNRRKNEITIQIVCFNNKKMTVFTVIFIYHIIFSNFIVQHFLLLFQFCSLSRNEPNIKFQQAKQIS